MEYRRLKPTPEIKIERLRRWPEGQLYLNLPHPALFPQPLKSCPYSLPRQKTEFFFESPQPPLLDAYGFVLAVSNPLPPEGP